MAIAKPLIGHIIAEADPYFEEEHFEGYAQMYDYIFGSDGVYVRAENAHMKAMFPIAHCWMKGLAALTADFHIAYEPVYLNHVEWMLTLARQYALVNEEVLFHLYRENGIWQTVMPEQTQSGHACKPLHDGPGSTHDRALIEVHSHHSMPARFSGTDNKDEQGFRLYGVLGNVLRRPEIRLRVGVYGHFWEIPASWVFDMPDGLIDCV